MTSWQARDWSFAGPKMLQHSAHARGQGSRTSHPLSLARAGLCCKPFDSSKKLKRVIFVYSLSSLVAPWHRCALQKAGFSRLHGRGMEESIVCVAFCVHFLFPRFC